jgi:hypothetical protein
VKSLMKMAPKALNALSSRREPGSWMTKRRKRLPATWELGEQLDLIEEIMRLTFPRGVGPFVEKLKGLGLLAAVDQ